MAARPKAVMSLKPIVNIVDDDADFRDSIQYLLKSVSLRACGYETAEEFLQAWNPNMPGCLLLDLHIPGMTGLELQRELRIRGLVIPIIFVSAHDDVPAAVRAMQVGALDFVTKPLDPDYLIDRVHAALALDSESRDKRRRRDVLRARIDLLTPRERDVFWAVTEGLSNREAGEKLGISHKTVELHRTNMMRKMKTSTVAGLVRMRMDVEQE